MLDLLFVSSAVAESGWLGALLQATARGALLLLGAAAATVLLRGASASARHLVWSTALLGLLALPVLPWLVPALTVPLPAAAMVAEAAGLRVLPAPEITLPRRTAVAGELPAAAPIPRAEETRGAAPQPRVEATSVDLALYWSLIALAVWTVGVLLVLGPLILASVRVHHEGRRAEPVTGGPLAALLEGLRRESGIRRRVILLRGGDSAMPVTWGLLRPRILLPQGAGGWPASRLRSVLLHELAHVRRADCLTQLLSEVACALYWFNPLVWMAARRLRAESEHACDDHVLRAGSRPSDYAGHLLEVARTLRAPGSVSVAAIAMARPSQLEGRLLAVLSAERRRGPLTCRVAVPVLLAASGAVLLLAAVSPAVRAAEAAVATDSSLPVQEGHISVQVPPDAPAPPAAPASQDAPLAFAPATPGQESRCVYRGRYSRHENSLKGHWKISWSNQEGCGGKAEIVGNVEFTPGLTGVARIERGGRFELELYDGRRRERVEVSPGDDGRLVRTWTVNGRQRGWDDEARRWMPGALRELFRYTTYGAEQHVRRHRDRRDM